MPCKGICSRYAQKHSPKSGGRYESGQKMCSSCNAFIKFDGKRCPCCGSALRLKPRNSRGREKITNLKN